MQLTAMHIGIRNADVNSEIACFSNITAVGRCFQFPIWGWGVGWDGGVSKRQRPENPQCSETIFSTFWGYTLKMFWGYTLKIFFLIILVCFIKTIVLKKHIKLFKKNQAAMGSALTGKLAFSDSTFFLSTYRHAWYWFVWKLGRVYNNTCTTTGG